MPHCGNSQPGLLAMLTWPLLLLMKLTALLLLTVDRLISLACVSFSQAALEPPTYAREIDLGVDGSKNGSCPTDFACATSTDSLGLGRDALQLPGGTAAAVSMASSVPRISAASDAASTAVDSPAAPTLRAATKAAMNRGAGGFLAGVRAGGGDGDSAESARRSLTLSLALAEQFAHADSSSEDEEADAEAAGGSGCSSTSISNGACGQGAQRLPTSDGGGNGASTPSECQLAPRQQQQQQQQPAAMHHCHSWDSASQQQQQQQVARRVAPHERLIIENQRRKVCQEIVETERKYCSCLWTLIDLIGGSLRAAAYVSTRDLCLIFPNTLPRLYDIHAEFLNSLEESDDCSAAAAVAAYRGQLQPAQCSLAQAVQRFLQSRERQLLQLYRSYVGQFGAAMRCVRRLRRRSKKFRDLLQNLQRHPDCEGLELTAFLLTPVQRLPRYLLLLRQLADRTDPRHPDLGHLSLATDRLRDLLDQLNCSIQGALAEATAWTGESSTASVPEEELAPSGDRQQQQQQQLHFLLLAGPSSRQRRRSTQPEALSHPCESPRHLKRSQQQKAEQPPGQPSSLQQQQQQQQQRCRSVPPEEPSSSRSRVVVFQVSPETARRLRHGERSRSVGDGLAHGDSRRRNSVHHVAPAAAAAASVAAASGLETPPTSAGRGRRRKSSPRTTVKETFRKMFLSRRKVSDSRLDSSWGEL